MTIDSYINAALLDEMLSGGYISTQTHPRLPLTIYNYTPKAQYDWEWNDATRKCRGLIVDDSKTVVARPYSKFFNLNNMDTIPDGPYDVWVKYDGSLGIITTYDGELVVATRGSFTSDQAQRARAMLEEKYKIKASDLHPDWTYLTEIIYPENRIVVEYNEEKLVFLGGVHTQTGRELGPYQMPHVDALPQAKIYGSDRVKDPSHLYDLEESNAEGFVIRWRDGTRAKVKFEEYVELHRIVTGCTAREIWRRLVVKFYRDKSAKWLTSNVGVGGNYTERLVETDDPVGELFDNAPDEVYDWAKAKRRELLDAFDQLLYELYQESQRLMVRESGKLMRGQTAKAYQASEKFPAGALFLMLDRNDPEAWVWKQIKPDHETPFSE